MEMIIPAKEQEESVRSALNVQMIIRQLGPQAVARADYVRGVQHRGEGQAIAQRPQAIGFLGRTCPSRSCLRKEEQVGSLRIK